MRGYEKIKIKNLFIFFFIVLGFIVIFSFAAGSPNLAARFNSNSDFINGWYWLRDASLQHYAQWVFEKIPSGDFDLMLDITALATDRPNGGSGFPANFFLIYEALSGEIFVTQEIHLPNTSPSNDPLGYTCHGQVIIPRAIVRDSTVLFVRIERILAEDHHIAFHQDSILLFTEEQMPIDSKSLRTDTKK